MSPALPVFAADEEVAEDSVSEEIVEVAEPEPDPEPEINEELEPEVEEVTELEPEPEIEEEVVNESGSEDIEVTKSDSTDDATVLEDTENLLPESPVTLLQEDQEKKKLDDEREIVDVVDDYEQISVEKSSTTSDLNEEVEKEVGIVLGENDQTSTSSETASSTTQDEVEQPASDNTIEVSSDSSVSTTTSSNRNQEIATSSEEVGEKKVVETVDKTEDDDQTLTMSPELDSEIHADTLTNDQVDSAEKPPVQTEIVYVIDEATSDLNRHTFSVDECVSVGSGSYYCSKDSSEQFVQLDSVYAQIDSDGDYEIYLQIDGEEKQLTDNKLDDKSPTFDIPAEQVVWHRLVNGRYQIIQYDLEEEKEKQLTSGSVNHMEPDQADGVTVWQQWDGNDWEVYGLIGGEMVRISDNEFNDVAPTIKNGFVMWHTTGVAGEKLLSVYEIDTGDLSTISDTDGGHVDNPRFVLVYDTVFENGDTVTKTYNPETGEIMPVGSQSAPEPVPTLPDPEPTGETTALLQNKSQSGRESGEVLDDSEVEDDSASSSSATQVESVDLSAESEVSEPEVVSDIDMQATSSEPFELTDFDLVVEPLNQATSTQLSNGTSSSDSVE